MKRIVHAVITTPCHENFFVQQKDDDHPVEEYRAGYTLFGGEIEGKEEPVFAIRREIEEELPFFRNFTYEPQFLGVSTLPTQQTFTFSITLSDEEFQELVRGKVLEGFGVSLKKNDFENLDWLPGAKESIQLFLK